MIPALLGSTAAVASAADGPSVILSGGTASYSSTSSPYAGWKFGRDGKTYRNQGVSTANWVYYSDWISVPSPTIGDGYDIRATYVSGLMNPPNSLNAGVGSWLALSTDQAWEDVDNLLIGETESDTRLTIEIRLTSGVVEDSGSYYMYALKV